MGWDVMGGARSAATWLDDKANSALDGAGEAVDGAVHGAEHAIDSARQSIVEFGARHGGVGGQAVAQEVSNGLGTLEVAGLAPYDMGHPRAATR